MKNLRKCKIQHSNLLKTHFLQTKGEICKKYSRDILIGSLWIDVPAQEHTYLVRRERLPTTGLFDEEISCLMVSDN